jgi:hydroxypyruvate reductase
MSSLLTELFLQVAARVDGAVLVTEALTAGAAALPPTGRVHVLALGKVAFPMFAGLRASLPPDRLGRGLLIAPEGRFPARLDLPPDVQALASDHPTPTARSVAAGRAARAFVETLGPADRLVVLLSGGGSALAALPAGSLSFEDKRATVTAVARAGATIHELNTVRKHLSDLKGGRLALATAAPTTVLALSDVVGNDPGTIASGPFATDPTTYAEALALVRRLAPAAPAVVQAWLEAGTAGTHPDTPKPGDPRLAHVTTHLLAGPERPPAEARALLAARGLATGALSQHTEEPVPTLAATYGARARAEVAAGGRTRVLVGNGEPTIVVTGDGRGGRATHLALLMARELAGLPEVSFLAAGTDDRDGSTDASGAVVDGTTWPRAQAAGLDPEGALARCDSERPLAALGCLVRGPGTSNLLDLHLLQIGPG